MESHQSSLTFADVDIRAELQTRQARARNHQAEDHSFALLAKEMAENPRNMLQKLVEVALEYCQAHTAGISLLESRGGKEVFRWEALTGVFGSQRNNTMPRDASPCGVTIDENTTQLMYLADRIFPALKADPPFIEALLIPFHFKGTVIGTVWVVSHTPDKQFDREDERFLKSLGQFASAGWQLWKSYEEIERANRAKDEFLAMVSHELRTPLTVIFTASSLLATHTLPPERSNSLVESIQRNAKLQLRVLNDLLHFTKLENGKMDLEWEVVDLAKVIAACIDTLRPEAQKKNINISATTNTVAVVKADAARLQQVVGNLLGNAVKFTPDGGMIDITVSPDKDTAVIAVKDNGIGISPEFLPHVFEKFRQHDPRGREGLGLGLAIVRLLVEAHGGHITVKSDGLGCGSEFIVTLPVEQNATQAAAG